MSTAFTAVRNLTHCNTATSHVREILHEYYTAVILHEVILCTYSEGNAVLLHRCLPDRAITGQLLILQVIWINRIVILTGCCHVVKLQINSLQEYFHISIKIKGIRDSPMFPVVWRLTQVLLYCDVVTEVACLSFFILYV